MKTTYFLFMVLSTTLSCYGQTRQAPITIKGTIGNQFHLSSTHIIKGSDQEDLLNELNDYFIRINQLDQYYAYKNADQEEEAEAIVASDRILSATNEFGIAYSYMMVKMSQLDILFKPLIQCHQFHESHIITITEKQLSSLEKYLNNRVEVELIIEKIGEIEMDKTSVYQLKRIVEN